MNGAKGEDGKDALDVRHVDALGSEWTSIRGATLTDDGAKFGPFADGEASSAIEFHGLDGLELSKLEAITYRQKVAVGDKMAVPYFRIFTKDAAGNSHSLIYSPSTQHGNDQPAGEWRTEKLVHGTARYDDDAGERPEEMFGTHMINHANDVITGVRVQAGNAGDYSAGSTSYVSSVRFALSGQSRMGDVLYTFGG